MFFFFSKSDVYRHVLVNTHFSLYVVHIKISKTSLYSWTEGVPNKLEAYLNTVDVSSSHRHHNHRPNRRCFGGTILGLQAGLVLGDKAISGVRCPSWPSSIWASTNYSLPRLCGGGTCVCAKYPDGRRDENVDAVSHGEPLSISPPPCHSACEFFCEKGL